jgi:hypothetical protein
MCIILVNPVIYYYYTIKKGILKKEKPGVTRALLLWNCGTGDI